MAFLENQKRKVSKNILISYQICNYLNHGVSRNTYSLFIQLPHYCRWANASKIRSLIWLGMCEMVSWFILLQVLDGELGQPFQGWTKHILIGKTGCQWTTPSQFKHSLISSNFFDCKSMPARPLQILCGTSDQVQYIVELDCVPLDRDRWGRFVPLIFKNLQVVTESLTRQANLSFSKLIKNKKSTTTIMISMEWTPCHSTVGKVQGEEPTWADTKLLLWIICRWRMAIRNQHHIQQQHRMEVLYTHPRHCYPLLRIPLRFCLVSFHFTFSWISIAKFVTNSTNNTSFNNRRRNRTHPYPSMMPIPHLPSINSVGLVTLSN